jgi:hypothetical protein
MRSNDANSPLALPSVAAIERNRTHAGERGGINLKRRNVEFWAARNQGALGPDLALTDLADGARVCFAGFEILRDYMIGGDGNVARRKLQNKS